MSYQGEIDLSQWKAADLSEFARAVPRPPQFKLTERVLPELVRDTTEFKSRALNAQLTTAKFRAFNAAPAYLERAASAQIISGKLPAISARQAIEETEIVAAGGNKLGDAIFDNVENEAKAIHTRLELAAGQLLSTGTIPLDADGTVLSFGVPEDHLPTAGVLWDQSNATPLQDEQAWIEKATDAGAPAPDAAFASRKVRRLLARNAEYRQAFHGRADGATLSPGQVDHVRAVWGLPELVDYDVAVEHNDEQKHVLPQDRIVLVSVSNSVGVTLFGRTAESVLRSAGLEKQWIEERGPGIFSRVYVDDDVAAVITTTSAVALPLLVSPTAVISGKVL